MKKIRLISLLLSLLFVLLCFTACSDPKETEKPTTTGESQTNEDGDPRKTIQDTVPKDLKYKDDTVTFFVRNDTDLYKYEISCEELKNDTLFDAIHYRNMDVESRLGVSIKTIGQPGNFNVHTAWNQTLSSSVLTNSHDYDATAFYVSTGSALAKDGIYYNLMNLSAEYGGGHLNFSKPWWNQTMVDELTIYGSLFFIGGDVTITEITDGFALAFNKDLFDQKFPDVKTENLYQLVRDGDWTIGKMTDFVSQVWDDTNSNGVIDDGDVVGFRSSSTSKASGWDGWIYALGLDLTTKDEFGEPQLTIVDDPMLMPAFEAARKLHSGTPGSLFLDKATETGIPYGNQLFGDMRLKDGAGYRASEVNYGVLPLPKYDEDQENYRTTFVNTASCIAICSNVSDERAVMLSAILELLCAESYKQVTPAYYGTVLQGQYSRDQADAEMYDLIIKSFVFSFGYAYSTVSLGAVGNIFRDLSPTFDLQTTVDSNRTMWKQNLTDLLIALENVSN